MVFLSNFPESEAECASGDSSLFQPSPFRFADAGEDPAPPSHLISCSQGIWVLWEVSFPAALAACGSLCKRKDILLILVINPLGISETGAKIVRKEKDASVFTSPSLESHHEILIVSSLPSFFSFLSGK